MNFEGHGSVQTCFMLLGAQPDCGFQILATWAAQGPGGPKTEPPRLPGSTSVISDDPALDVTQTQG